ncbi:hypothetical protein VDGE_30393 [Verticillium dahliae]|uniref:Uncharacterized protein n=1 Tax=Verticillium dahliae TaxID=27337 RepID=A0A444RIU7_VERDA|nr:hypothetical protein VDGE_30393 [Verticillium dahliae]
MRHRRIGPLAGAGLGLGLVAIASGQTQCFFPNGTDALRTNSNGDFFPCEYPGFGMCCASLDDRCLGALCWSSTTNGLYRGGCTDTAWVSEECLHLCTGGKYLEGDETKTLMDSRNVPVTQCTDGRYCCGSPKGTAVVLAHQSLPRRLKERHRGRAREQSPTSSRWDQQKTPL